MPTTRHDLPTHSIPASIRLSTLAGLAALVTGVAVDAQSPSWTRIDPATKPKFAYGHALVFDAARQRTVLFEGTRTWEWDGADWTRRQPARSPASRNWHAMAYDSVRRRVVLFGGLDANDKRLNETWEWDGVRWMLRRPAKSPSPSSNHSMVYDSVRQRTVLLVNGTRWFDAPETWEWDGQTWGRVSTATGLPSGSGRAMAHDPVRQRVVLFGGVYRNAWMNSTHEYDGRTWKLVGQGPADAGIPTLAHDTARQRTVLLSHAMREHSSAGTSEWDGRAWTHVATAAKSPGPGKHTFDSVRQRVVLVTDFGETWEYGLPAPALSGAPAVLPIHTGGTQVLSFRGGANLSGKPYLVLGSISATAPGMVVRGMHIPLNADAYMSLAIGAANTGAFVRFAGTLDAATSSATASLRVPPLRGVPAGVRFDHAFVVFDPGSWRVLTASNPVPLTLR